MWRRVAPFRQCGPLIGPEEGLRRAESAAAQSEAARRRRGVVAASPCPQESYRADTPLPPRPPDGPQQAGSEASDGVSPSLARVPASAGELPRVAPVRSHGHPPRRQHSARPGRRTGERALSAEEQGPAAGPVPALGAYMDAAFLALPAGGLVGGEVEVGGGGFCRCARARYEACIVCPHAGRHRARGVISLPLPRSTISKFRPPSFVLAIPFYIERLIDI